MNYAKAEMWKAEKSGLNYVKRNSVNQISGFAFSGWGQLLKILAEIITFCLSPSQVFGPSAKVLQVLSHIPKKHSQIVNPQFVWFKMAYQLSCTSNTSRSCVLKIKSEIFLYFKSRFDKKFRLKFETFLEIGNLNWISCSSSKFWFSLVYF